MPDGVLALLAKHFYEASYTLAIYPFEGLQMWRVVSRLVAPVFELSLLPRDINFGC